MLLHFAPQHIELGLVERCGAFPVGGRPRYYYNRERVYSLLSFDHVRSLVLDLIGLRSPACSLRATRSGACRPSRCRRAGHGWTALASRLGARTGAALLDDYWLAEYAQLFGNQR